MPPIRTIDLFCGAGGSSWGARLAGAKIVAAFDAWGVAEKAYKANFPEARFYQGQLEEADVKVVAKKVGRFDLIIASPECTNHTPAKGKGPRCEESKNTAFQVTRFARVMKPRWIVIENVVNMRNWTRYDEFLAELNELGYSVKPQVLKADNFGVPQRRRRLFILCDREQMPDEVIPGKARIRTAREIVDQNGRYSYSPLLTERRAKATLERADRAMDELGTNQPFLIVYYGSDHAGGWQSLDVPLRTVTTLDRFALVKPDPSGHVMRMLQIPELRAAMGMPKKFMVSNGTRRDGIKLLGNAVCPPVMRAAVRTLIGGARTER